MIINDNMSHKWWMCVLLLASFTGCVHLTVTITSSPKLGVETVCINQDVTLTCHTDQTTDNMITWYWYNQSQHGDNITVVATTTGVVYTCVESNNGEALSNFTVTVVANGAPPSINRTNYREYVFGYEGESLSFVTNITSSLPLSYGYPKWVGFHRPLPPASVVGNYTKDGILHSSLSLYDISYEDDSGNYTNIVANECGTSSIFVYLEVHKSHNQCLNYGSLAPLLSGPTDHTTVEEESISFECLYNGNYDRMRLLLYSQLFYWQALLNNVEQPVVIRNNDTKSYRIAVYQTCLTANFSCCTFVSRLTIYDTSMNLDGATVQCFEFLQTIGPALHVTANSSLTVYGRPKVTVGPKSVRASTGAEVSFTCHLEAPTKPGVSVIVWLKNDFQVTESSHFTITTTTEPTSKFQIKTTLTISSVTTEDDGKYTCYCYYNRSMVTSSQYVTSNQKSANLHVKDGSELSHTLTAFIIAGSASVTVIVLLTVIIIVCLVVRIVKRKSMSVKMVDLGRHNEGDEDEKRPLLPPVQETYKKVEAVATDRSSGGRQSPTGHFDQRQFPIPHSDQRQFPLGNSDWGQSSSEHPQLQSLPPMKILSTNAPSMNCRLAQLSNGDQVG